MTSGSALLLLLCGNEILLTGAALRKEGFAWLPRLVYSVISGKSRSPKATSHVYSQQQEENRARLPHLLHSHSSGLSSGKGAATFGVGLLISVSSTKEMGLQRWPSS